MRAGSPGVRLSAGRPDWTIARIRPGHSRTVYIQVRTTADARGVRCNRVRVTAPGTSGSGARACVRINSLPPRVAGGGRHRLSGGHAGSRHGDGRGPAGGYHRGMQEISVLSYPVAFAAGFVSFASPCVLAVVPGYLSFISGVTFDELGTRTRDVMVPTIAFVTGFSLMFTAYGASAGLIGYSLTSHQDALNLVAGLLLIAMGIAMVALPQFGLMQTERRIPLARRPTTLAGAGFVGAAFAVGWTPCIGPILGSILGYAAPTGSPGLGASLLFTYSLGLGIPFLLSGLFITRTMAAFRWMRDRWRVVNATAAAVFIMIGVLVATGRFEVITQRLSGVGFTGI